MTEAAAKAMFLVRKEKWEDAALALYGVYKGETNDDEGNRQLAQYNLAIALYNQKYYQGSYAVFSEVAENPSHIKFNETLLWLAKLATELPEPADIVERVGKYDEEAVAKFNNPNQKELYWQLNYLLGRYKYRNGQFNDAVSLFQKVGRQSKFYVKAQFFAGISNVQLRTSEPAVKAFKNVTTAVEEGEVEEDGQRMRDLAYLSIARTLYSASISVDDTNTPKINEDRLTAAVRHWNKVDVGSEYWLDALFEESWAYFMAGDYAHALGNIHSINAAYFPKAYYPEGEILKAVVYFSNCQYEDAGTITAKFQAKYQPIYDELNGVLKRFKDGGQEEEFYKFMQEVRSGKADLSPRIRSVVEGAMSDRQLLRHLKYVELLDKETERFKKSSQKLQGSPLGGDIKDSLQLARDIAVRNAGTLAKERYQRNLAELEEQLRNAQKIVIDISSAQRNQLDTAIAGTQVSVQESQRNVVKGDDEHVIWPFDGEYWRDELGFYRQTITSKCGR